MQRHFYPSDVDQLHSPPLPRCSPDLHSTLHRGQLRASGPIQGLDSKMEIHVLALFFTTVSTLILFRLMAEGAGADYTMALLVSAGACMILITIGELISIAISTSIKLRRVSQTKTAAAEDMIASFSYSSSGGGRIEFSRERRADHWRPNTRAGR